MGDSVEIECGPLNFVRFEGQILPKLKQWVWNSKLTATTMEQEHKSGVSFLSLTGVDRPLRLMHTFAVVPVQRRNRMSHHHWDCVGCG